MCTVSSRKFRATEAKDSAEQLMWAITDSKKVFAAQQLDASAPTIVSLHDVKVNDVSAPDLSASDIKSDVAVVASPHDHDRCVCMCLYLRLCVNVNRLTRATQSQSIGAARKRVAATAASQRPRVHTVVEAFARSNAVLFCASARACVLKRPVLFAFCASCHVG